VSSSRYHQALEYLFARTTGGVRLGLDRTHALLAHLGDPHRAIPVFHVAGTNGKGSTVAALRAFLEYQGHRVATYTSPHLIDFRERIVVAGEPISEDEVVAFIDRNLDQIERLGATFFEATTAMAFDHIARSGADVAVIETGLGGRLDSTNVVDPLAAIVTSIGLDHTELLGNTLEEIAAEKAGIFKRGRAAVIGERWPDILALLQRRAADAGASPIRTLADEVEIGGSRVTPDGTEFEARWGGDVVETRVGLIGSHQPGNIMTAWLALQAAGGEWAVALNEIQASVGGLKLPGRFHREGNIVLDVAHNPAGMAVVAGTLARLDVPKPVVALVGILSDKDWRAMLRAVATVADEIIATVPPTAPAERRWNLEEVARFARDASMELRCVADFDTALHLATADPTHTALITGSFHTVGDAMARLQVNPLAR
jgi:dihydrofolate synthase/folylpolyglutamate synthase